MVILMVEDRTDRLTDALIVWGLGRWLFGGLGEGRGGLGSGLGGGGGGGEGGGGELIAYELLPGGCRII